MTAREAVLAHRPATAREAMRSKRIPAQQGWTVQATRKSDTIVVRMFQGNRRWGESTMVPIAEWPHNLHDQRVAMSLFAGHGDYLNRAIDSAVTAVNQVIPPRAEPRGYGIDTLVMGRPEDRAVSMYDKDPPR